MKKIFALMMAFAMMTGLFADIKLIPKDKFNDLSADFKRKTGMQCQIGYVADTWEDVYKKTGKGKYAWSNIGSDYVDDVEQCYVILRVLVEGDLMWVCYEYPGDGSATAYVAD